MVFFLHKLMPDRMDDPLYSCFFFNIFKKTLTGRIFWLNYVYEKHDCTLLMLPTRFLNLLVGMAIHSCTKMTQCSLMLLCCTWQTGIHARWTSWPVKMHNALSLSVGSPGPHKLCEDTLLSIKINLIYIPLTIHCTGKSVPADATQHYDLPAFLSHSGLYFLLETFTLVFPKLCHACL